MRVLVTGATGFIGRAIAEALANAGYDVVRGARRVPDHRTNQTWVAYGDLRQSVDWQPVLENCDAVIHCAGLASVSDTKDGASDAAAINVEATAALAASAARAGITHIVYISSATVYGPQVAKDTPINQATVPRPLGAYARSKLAAEQRLVLACEGTDLAWTILRPAMVYGIGAGGNFSRLVGLVRSRIPLPLGAATAPKSFLSVRNLTDVVRLSLERKEARYRTFVVCDPEPSSTAALARHIAQALGRTRWLLPIPQTIVRWLGKVIGREGDVARMFEPMQFDCTELRTALGWVPSVRTEEGVREALRVPRSTSPDSNPDTPTLVFLVNVDWFFRSHFLFLAQRARASGARVIVATHLERTGTALTDEGFEILSLPRGRGGLMPPKLASTIVSVRSLLAGHPGAVLHGFGLFGVLVGSLAYPARRRRAVFTITGRGFSAIDDHLASNLVRLVTREYFRLFADRGQVRWLAENERDLLETGLATAVREGRTAIVGGAGIDPDAFTVGPMPSRGPLRCALVARAIWSKGLDVAVEAIKRAREQGGDVALSLVGAPDADNPRSYSREELEAFARVPGVEWLGHVDAIDALWRSHHIALLPTRGGEGVPKSLIEGAACGRPVITTDVPGCRELAMATGGWVVPVNDVEALATRLLEVSRITPAELETRSAMARQGVLDGYTQDRHWQTASKWYKDLASR